MPSVERSQLLGRIPIDETPGDTLLRTSRDPRTRNFSEPDTLAVLTSMEGAKGNATSTHHSEDIEHGLIRRDRVVLPQEYREAEQLQHHPATSETTQQQPVQVCRRWRRGIFEEKPCSTSSCQGTAPPSACSTTIHPGNSDDTVLRFASVRSIG